MTAPIQFKKTPVPVNAAAVYQLASELRAQLLAADATSMLALAARDLGLLVDAWHRNARAVCEASAGSNSDNSPAIGYRATDIAHGLRVLLSVLDAEDLLDMPLNDLERLLVLGGNLASDFLEALALVNESATVRWEGG